MIAFLREISPHLDRCELHHLPRRQIEVEKAKQQHAAFAAALRELGLVIEFSPVLPDHPAGLRVGDAAILLPEITIIARHEASHMPEIDSVANTLEPYRLMQRIADDGTLDGGDVLRIGRMLFVAQTRQTSAEGIFSLQEIVEPYGYTVKTVELRDCESLKSAATFIPPHFLVANPAWVNPTDFGNLVLLPVDETEPFAANTLTVAGTSFVSASYPKTTERLREAGIATHPIEIDEFEKVGAGVSSLCLILEPRAIAPVVRDFGLRTIEIPGLPRPDGHESQAIVHDGLVYVSLQMSTPSEPRRKSRISVEEQTERILENVAVILTTAGSSLPRVLRATIHLADPKCLAQVEPVYARVLGGHRPVRTVIVNKALPTGVLVAIEVVAIVAGENA